MFPGMSDVSPGVPALAVRSQRPKIKRRAPAVPFFSKWSVQMAWSAEPAAGSRRGKIEVCGGVMR